MFVIVAIVVVIVAIASVVNDAVVIVFIVETNLIVDDRDVQRRVAATVLPVQISSVVNQQFHVLNLACLATLSITP